ncbi:Outer membrane protein OmpA [Loktanella atrilutea]|uniref:Outer membrane protein OmpA n=1 Tax=Loktanella atrilutea TaxID=366533 RepID=A0A1M5BXB0_LOKAT|nr:OmpA family protein [Loktanella atrilutea]SHF47129.1 Outer membrane protein OmpA [Loktanella atrilutea]
MKTIVTTTAAALSLMGCAQEAGTPNVSASAGAAYLDPAFGSATALNAQAMTDAAGATSALGARFAAEVDSTVNFAFNSAQLDATAQTVLATQANWIRQFPEIRFRVYGFTDLVGSAAYNKRLGLARANAVVAYLASQGISRSRLEALVSYGETRPVIPTAAPERQNRRAVTEVSGFVKGSPMLLNGKYAQVIFREYIASAVPAPNISATVTSTAGGE